MTKHRVSFGIALCRTDNNGQDHILYIKKRYTYYFFDFIYGKYKYNDHKYLTKMFNNMNFQEKIAILKGNFNELWYTIWLDVPGGPPNQRRYLKGINHYNYKQSYDKSRIKFNKIYNNKYHILRKLINHSTNSNSVWEIPKGRKDKYEMPMESAIREFKEETNISPDKYKIMWHINPITESYIDAGVKYTNIYFMARVNDNNWDPKVYFNKLDQIIEIEAIKWIGIEELRFMVNNKYIQKHTTQLYKNIITSYRRYAKLPSGFTKAKKY